MRIDYTQLDQEIYKNELKYFLPKKIFDAHIHLFDESNLKDDYIWDEKNCLQKFGRTFTMEQYLEYTKKLLPNNEVYCNSFGFPDIKADREKASIYTGEISDNKKYFGMALVSPRDSIEDIKSRIEKNNLVGYKPYLNFVDWKEKDDITINDMLTKEQMEYANEKGLIITLHIPRSGRLADPVNQKQMVDLCHQYPNVKIIFAHIGRAYYMQNIIGFLDELANCANAYIDTAMVNHEGILEYALNNFPRKKILFGSDAPIAFLYGKSVEINNQYAYLMGEDYQIGTAIYDSNNSVNFTTFFYEQLRGIKIAANSANLLKLEIEDIFFNNAYNLFKSKGK